MQTTAHLVLSDGTIFRGKLLGASQDTTGEVVFNTGMTGYQEILTDPSYSGQIVCLTYPMIGNYGINPDDDQSSKVQAAGLLVREACDFPSNWRKDRSLEEYLIERGVTAMQGIDTRALTLKIRSSGVTMGVITTGDPETALAELQSRKSYDETDFVYQVTTRAPYAWGRSGKESLDEPGDKYKGKIVALDFGLKHNILRRFAALGYRTIVLPATATKDEILEWNPQGILLSPGPGDPMRLDPIVETVKQLLGVKPIFGICLGNQILCRAIGGSTYKMPFGHRGSNHPVKDLLDGTVTITSQNHGYAVEPDSLMGTPGEVTQINLNDKTVEGIQIKEVHASSIQYHPEAAPGPWDSRKYFSRFVESFKHFK